MKPSKVSKIYFLHFMFVLFCLTTSQTTTGIITTSSKNPKKTKANFNLRQNFCSQSPISKLSCAKFDKNACASAQTIAQTPVCGFDHLGVKFDFKRQCEICQNINIKYYFLGTCDNAPLLCPLNNQCINGLCIQMLDQDSEQDRQVCNLKEDCSSIAEICIANKCVNRRDLPSLLGKTKTKSPQILKKSEMVRAEANKYSQQRQQQQNQQLTGLMNYLKSKTNHNNINNNNQSSGQVLYPQGVSIASN